eukprot:scaffold19845_cov131-Skeletonema_marinoi.AAC.2
MEAMDVHYTAKIYVSDCRDHSQLLLLASLDLDRFCVECNRAKKMKGGSPHLQTCSSAIQLQRSGAVAYCHIHSVRYDMAVNRGACGRLRWPPYQDTYDVVAMPIRSTNA